MPATDTPTPEPTDTPTPEPDTTPPSISAFSISNPSEQDLRVSFESDEQIGAIQVSISGAEMVTLNTDNFSEAVSGGTYTYEATYEASSDGDYTATLNEASDGNGNNGADGEAVSLSVDTTAPTISSFSISNTSEQNIQISFISTEPVSTLEVSISGEEDATLTLSDFNETVSGEEYNYEATYQASSGGDYTATLIEASDSDDNDGAGSESASITLPTDGIVAEDELISRWPFEESFEDGVGDNDATADLGNPTIDTYANRDAVEFSAGNALRISRGGHGNLSLMGSDNGPSTFSMWVYFDSETGDGNTWDGRDEPYHSILTNDTGYAINAIPSSTDGSVDLRFGINGTGSSESGYSIPESEYITATISEWHHFAVIANPTESVDIYLDGEQVFSDDSMNGYNNPNDDFWTDLTVGGKYGGNPEEWLNIMDGKISDLRIYETGLSADDISNIYNNTA